MEHIVLEYDENTRTALVVATSGGHEPVLSGHASPYIVADGYDFESRSWGAGHYFTDIAQAKIDRLGGKIELCVDGIDADIGKVRAFASSSPVVRAFVDPLCAYIPAPSDSVREQERDISPYLRQIAQRCQRISHSIDPPETASAATRATFGGTAAWPVYRGHKN